MLALALAAALIPSLLLLWYFHTRDIYPEPGRVIWATFFLGIATIPPILIFDAAIEPLIRGIRDLYLYGLAQAFLSAALPEELGKFVVLTRYAARHKEFNEPMDGVVYGVAVSLGFATLENVLYVGGGGMGVAVARALTAVPAHAFTGAIMGYYVGCARFAEKDRARLWALALLFPMLLHGLYDFPILVLRHHGEIAKGEKTPGAVAALVLLTLVTLVWEGRLAVRLSRRLRAAQGAAPAPSAAVEVALDAGARDAAAAQWSQQSPKVAPAAPGVLLGRMLLVLGGLLATGGGLLILLLVVGMASGGQRDVPAILLGGAVLGGLPLGLGLLLYRAGLRRLNQAAPAKLEWR